MRIALIKKKYGLGGGAERYARTVAEGLSERGHEVKILAERFDAPGQPGLVWAPVPRGGTTLLRARNFHLRAQRVLAALPETDLVYGLSRTYPVDVFRVTEQLHAKWLAMGYSYWQQWNPRHRSLLRLERQTLTASHTRRVVTNSRLIQKQVVEIFGFPADRVKVIRNGVDHDSFHPPKNPDERARLRANQGIKPDTNVLLLVAEDFRIKGLSSAIKALAGLPAGLLANTRLRVAGSDNPRHYRRLAQKLGVEKNLRFLGRQENMRELYATADLLVCPSLYEPFANVCLEACACGLPVLTTADNGAAEMLGPDGGGYVVENAAMTDKITRLIAGHLSLPPPARQARAEAAVEAAADYCWERHVDELENLFQEVVSHRAC